MPNSIRVLAAQSFDVPAKRGTRGSAAGFNHEIRRAGKTYPFGAILRATAVEHCGETQLKTVIARGEFARPLPIEADFHIFAVYFRCAYALAFAFRAAGGKKADGKVISGPFRLRKTYRPQGRCAFHIAPQVHCFLGQAESPLLLPLHPMPCLHCRCPPTKMAIRLRKPLTGNIMQRREKPMLSNGF